MSGEPDAIDLQSWRTRAQLLETEIGKAILGQAPIVRLITVALFARGRQRRRHSAHGLRSSDSAPVVASAAHPEAEAARGSTVRRGAPRVTVQGWG